MFEQGWEVFRRELIHKLQSQTWMDDFEEEFHQCRYRESTGNGSERPIEFMARRLRLIKWRHGATYSDRDIIRQLTAHTRQWDVYLVMAENGTLEEFWAKVEGLEHRMLEEASLFRMGA